MKRAITLGLVIVVSLSLIPIKMAMATVFDSSGEAVGGESPFFRPQPPAQITPPDNFLQLPPPSSSSAPTDGAAATDPGFQQQSPQQLPEQEQGTKPEDEDEDDDEDKENDEEEENEEDNDNNIVFSLGDTPQRVCAGYNQLSNEDKLLVIFSLVPNDRHILLDKLSTCNSIIIQGD
jgi:DNA mismatch repair ATPase MutL